MEIGERIKEIRTKKRIRQEDIAIKLGLSRVTITNIENGKNKGNFEILKNICEILDISADYILFGNKKTNMNYEKLDKIGQEMLKNTYDMLLDKHPAEEQEVKKVGNL